MPASALTPAPTQGVKLDDLTPGFVVAEKGGVVRLAELQQQGYAYLRP
jgi:Domain of unknown function (DUF1791).